MEKTAFLGLSIFLVVTCFTWAITTAAPTLDDGFLDANTSTSMPNSTNMLPTGEPSTVMTSDANSNTTGSTVTGEPTGPSNVTMATEVIVTTTPESTSNVTAIPYINTTDIVDNTSMPFSIEPAGTTVGNMSSMPTENAPTVEPPHQTTGNSKHTTASTTTTTKKSDHRFDGGSFAGGIVLGMAVIFIICVAVYCVKFRNRGSSYSKYT